MLYGCEFWVIVRRSGFGHLITARNWRLRVIQYPHHVFKRGFPLGFGRLEDRAGTL